MRSSVRDGWQVSTTYSTYQLDYQRWHVHGPGPRALISVARAFRYPEDATDGVSCSHDDGTRIDGVTCELARSFEQPALQLMAVDTTAWSWQIALAALKFDP